MSIAKRILPPEQEANQEREETALSGMSLEDAIQEFVKIDALLTELSVRKKEVLSILIPAAFEVRGSSNTTRLDSSDRKTQLKVEFKSYFKCEADRLNTVRDLLGDDLFEDLFKTEFKPKLRGLKPFLASKSTDERIETAKTVIREAVKEQDLSPQITIEKGRSEIPF